VELAFGLLKDGQMKRATFTEEQIIGMLREHDAGAKTADLEAGLSEATLYTWKASTAAWTSPRITAAPETTSFGACDIADGCHRS
jgi:hypothetical protein